MSYIDKCSIPVVWCGKGDIPTRKSGDEKYYIRKGTTHECMQIGFGAGKYSEIKKGINNNSLQNIKYVGETYENNFKEKNIDTILDLIKYVSSHTQLQIKLLLSSVFKKKGGGTDMRAYNSTLMFVYKKGIKDLPPCLKITKK